MSDEPPDLAFQTHLEQTRTLLKRSWRPLVQCPPCAPVDLADLEKAATACKDVANLLVKDERLRSELGASPPPFGSQSDIPSKSWSSPSPATPAPTQPQQCWSHIKSTFARAISSEKDDKSSRSSSDSNAGIWPDLKGAFMRGRNQLFCVFGVGKRGVSCDTRANHCVDLAAAFFLLVRNMCAAMPHNQRRAW